MLAANPRPSNRMRETLLSLRRRIRHKARVYLSFTIHFCFVHWYRWNARRDNPNVRFIAITLIEHLGDIVACEPVSRYVRSKEPTAKIIWFVKKEYRELVESNPSVDLVVNVHCLTEKDYMTAWCRFDQLFDLHFFERFCTLCGKTGTRMKSKRKNSNEITLHNFYNFGNILQSMSLYAGLPPLDEPPYVYITGKVKSNIDALLLPPQFVVFHCSSNTIEKDFPREKWDQVARYIFLNYGYSIVEVGLQAILGDLNTMLYRNCAGKLSILETAEVIRRAKLFVGIDSGPAHLANSVGTYGIVLLGSYLGFKKYNPFSGNYGNGKSASLIYVEGVVANISLESVQRSIDVALGMTFSQFQS